MSARTPFMPVSRPPSRLNHHQDAQKAADPQFLVDPSSPLNVAANKSSSTVDIAPHVETSVPKNSENRPLNTGSLIKRKNPLQQQSTRRPFHLPEKPSTRPGTVDPRSVSFQETGRSNSCNIIAPVPRLAPRPSSPILSNNLASGVFTINTSQPKFRMPDLPVQPPINDTQHKPKNEAHISNNSLGFSFSNPHAVQKNQLPSPPDSFCAKGSRNFITSESELPPPFTLNLSASGQTGPQRVLLNPDGTRGPPVPEDDSIVLAALDRTQTALLKRSRTDSDIDSEHLDDSNGYKRYRNQDDGYQREKSVTSHVSSPGSVSVQSRHCSHTPDMHLPYELHNEPSSPTAGNKYREQHFYPHPDAGHIANDGPLGLDKLLGRDVNAHMEEHAEQYEKAVARWKDCTMKDWIAGADEQAARYSKILDFVKDHMTSKMKLFGGFDARIDGHHVVLSERESVLEAVKGRLVQESTHVLGHGC